LNEEIRGEREMNIIITEPSASLRELGRNALAGKWKVAILAVVVYTICAELPVAIFDTFMGTNIGSNLYSTSYNTYNMSVDTYNSIYNSLPDYSPISVIYTLLISGAFNLGLCMFFLALFRKRQVAVTDIFLGFEKFGKALGLFLFETLFIFLWTCLFIVPGIIAAIRYSQAFYILSDDPSKSIRQCMNESKQMMKGNKAKYFCLALSFIGWALLAAVISGIVESISEILYMSGIVEIIVSLIGQLILVPLLVYIYSTYAGFYEILAGHLIKETEPAPVTPETIAEASAAQTETENNDQL
jgi:uncharacterized membrane protein